MQIKSQTPNEPKKYPIKWAICYKDKPYIEVYGKKKAHDLLYRLSQSCEGLSVQPVMTPSKKTKGKQLSKNEYYKKWRNRNREKLRQYQREYYRRRREAEKGKSLQTRDQ